MNTQKNEVVAAIDVGSNAIRMKIAEIKTNGKIIPLEDLKKSVNLGKDTFSFGKINVDTIHETCDILKDFNKVMKQYKIKNYRAVCTSAIREAENRDYMLNQIKIKGGIDVHVINNAEERFLTYKAIRDRITDYEKVRREGAIIVDIGSGGVEVSLYKNGYLNLTEYIKIGSLRLREILDELESRTLNFPDIMEEFIESKIYLSKAYINKMDISNFIGVGGELRIISMLCNNSKDEDKMKIVSIDDLNKLYLDIRKLTTDNIVRKYGISMSRAEILLPSIIIFKKFLEATKAKFITAPLVSLRDGLIADIVDNKFNMQRKDDFIEDIVYSVRCIGRKYNYDEKHTSHVEKLALSVFDQTKRIHGMGETERFYLQIAAILHDIGKFVNLNDHYINSYNIIMASDIIGLSNEDLEIVANVARYHSEEKPSLNHENYKKLDYINRVKVSKLSGILQIADSLDISHNQKIDNVSISVDSNLKVLVEVNDNILLEQWTFDNKAEFFEEVFGIRPIIKRKGR